MRERFLFSVVVLTFIICSTTQACLSGGGCELNPDGEKYNVVEYFSDKGRDGLSFPESAGNFGIFEDITGLIFDEFNLRRYLGKGEYLPEDRVWIENYIHNSGAFNFARGGYFSEQYNRGVFGRHGNCDDGWSFHRDHRDGFSYDWRGFDWDRSGDNTPTPEPATALILGIGGLFIAIRRRHH
jgi:hypothetical protein